jgi:hypothetical protein
MHETTGCDPARLRLPPQSAPVDRSPAGATGLAGGLEASTLVGPGFQFDVLGRPWRPPYGPTGGFFPNGWGPRVM